MIIRKLAALAVALTFVGGDVAVVASTPEGRPSPRAATYAAQVATPIVPVPREFEPLGLGSAAHNAFPSTTKLPDGRVLVMWRESSGHLAKDGKTFMAAGNPVTGMWSEPSEVVLDTSSPTRDMRPAMLSTIDGAVWLTYFFWENGVPAGAYVTKSTDGGQTFGTSVRVDGGRPYAAISSPVVKVAGKLVTAWYGRNAGENVDTAWWSWSTNGGATWSTNRIANAIGAGKAYNEPFAIVRGNTLMVLMRDGGWSGLALRSSPDGGTTWPATSFYHILDNATGNPASVWASNGNIYLVYRHTGTRDAMLAVSRDSGATFQVDPVPLLRAPANLGKDALGMVYGSPIDLGDGMVWAPIGLEASLTRASLFAGWL